MSRSVQERLRDAWWIICVNISEVYAGLGSFRRDADRPQVSRSIFRKYKLMTRNVGYLYSSYMRGA
jgi:hypothetical protein